MSHTKHTCYRTSPAIKASDIAAWCLAVFPFATLLALVLWGDWIEPWALYRFGF